MKDTQYYDRISKNYSHTRYPARANTYVQYFFKERLKVVLALIRECVGDRTELSILEIGCADGVVMRAIYEAFPNTFSTLDAVDISAGMIEAARELHKDTPIHFEERAKLSPRQYDLVIEVGVLNYTPFAEDIAVITASLVPDGSAIISIAGSDSQKNKFSPDRGYMHFESYAAYEKQIEAQCKIRKMLPVGLFMPFIWRIPALGRALQPLLEQSFANHPALFHEQVLVIQRR